MARSLALLAFSSAVMAAQSTTVSLLLPFADPQPLVGSVVAADSTATTYAFACPSGTSPDDCGFIGSETVTQGPSTWAFSMSYSVEGNSLSEGGTCVLNTAKDAATCSMQLAQVSGGSIHGSASSGVEAFLTYQLPVTITAGLEKLKATPGATATGGSTSAPTNTGTSQTASPGSSGSTSTTLARQTSAASTGNSTRTATSTAGPHSTNAAGIVNAQNGLLAGVAALVGGVMML